MRTNTNDLALAGTSEEHIRTVVRSLVLEGAELPPTQVDGQTPFAALGLDSLQIATLAVELEERFSMKLPDYVGYEYPCIDALSSFVWSELGSRHR
jgi:acyl carrier protein